MKKIFPPFLNYRDLVVRNFLAFLLCLFMLHGYEWIRISFLQDVDVSWLAVVSMGFLGDLIFALSLFAILTPIFLLFRLLLGPISGTVFIAICLILLLIAVAISNYFLLANVPLEADFWGYSAADIINTIQNSSEIDIISIVALFILPLLCRVLSKPFHEVDFGKAYKVLMALCLVGLLAFIFFKPQGRNFDSRSGYYLSLSKLSFFVDKSIMYAYDQGRPKDYDNLLENNAYPFEQSLSKNNTLTDFFEIKKDVQPNVLFIGIEGLGADFLYKGQNAGFMPFTDSLIHEGLYWENALSNTGRTFGFLPSILAGLPYAKQGFLETGPGYPKHTSIIQILNNNAYNTRFYYGGNASFDKMGIFLEHQKTDEIVDASIISYRYENTIANYKTNYWGYEDRAIFDAITTDLKQDSTPTFAVTLSLTSHEPFESPYEEYLDSAKFLAKKLKGRAKTAYENNPNIFACLNYVDASIKALIETIANDSTLHNTIIVLTGDHRLIPVPMDNGVQRFRVPILIWSPLLKKKEIFSGVTSHADVYPSICALLQSNYGVEKMPQTIQSISKGGLPTGKEVSTGKSLGFMRNKGDLNQFLQGDLMLVDNTVYKLDSNYTTTSIGEPSIDFSAALANFKNKNTYAIDSNRVYNGKINVAVLELFELSAEELSVIAYYKVDSIGVDSTLQLAYSLAFDSERIKARALAKAILNRAPNYGDARILLGRTYAWDGKYKEAKVALKEAIKRSPTYEDGYLALSDAYRWSDDRDSAVVILKKAQVMFPESEVLGAYIDANFIELKAGEQKK